MKLDITLGNLYVNGLPLCFVGAGNGRENLPAGNYPVTASFSHAHSCDLPRADGLGWIGPSSRSGAASCDIVLGRIRDGHGQVIECHSFIVRLLALIEAAEDRGETVELVVS